MHLDTRHKDLLIVVSGVVATYCLSLFFNLAEELSESLSQYEDLQLDEIPLALFVLAILSVWFSNRRVRELKLETNLRKLAENHLRSSQHLYKTLFDGDLTGNCVLNLDGEVLMSNSAFNRICNLSIHQHNVKSLFDFDWQDFKKRLNEVVELNYPKLKVHRTDGALCFVIARFIHIKPENITETKPQIHVYLVDITEQCLAEMDLEKTLKENQHLARHAISVQEKERKFIAQEIHDETGQYLTSIRMDALALQKTDPTKMLEIAARIASNIGHVQKTIHALIKQLRPIALNSQGLGEAIKQLFQDWRVHNHATYSELDLGLEDYIFPEEINIVAFRIVQESLTNITKHANASNVRVKICIALQENQQNLTIEVQDNGKGINFKKPNGLGLVGMRERVESLEGKFFIKSERYVGTCITAQIPIHTTQPEVHPLKVISL
jgi:signal transduction histidine kinase